MTEAEKHAKEVGDQRDRVEKAALQYAHMAVHGMYKDAENWCIAHPTDRKCAEERHVRTLLYEAKLLLQLLSTVPLTPRV